MNNTQSWWCWCLSAFVLLMGGEVWAGRSSEAELERCLVSQGLSLSQARAQVRALYKKTYLGSEYGDVSMFHRVGKRTVVDMTRWLPGEKPKMSKATREAMKRQKLLADAGFWMLFGSWASPLLSVNVGIADGVQGFAAERKAAGVALGGVGLAVFGVSVYMVFEGIDYYKKFGLVRNASFYKSQKGPVAMCLRKVLVSMDRKGGVVKGDKTHAWHAFSSWHNQVFAPSSKALAIARKGQILELVGASIMIAGAATFLSGAVLFAIDPISGHYPDGRPPVSPLGTLLLMGGGSLLVASGGIILSNGHSHRYWAISQHNRRVFRRALKPSKRSSAPHPATALNAPHKESITLLGR